MIRSAELPYFALVESRAAILALWFQRVKGSVKVYEHLNGVCLGRAALPIFLYYTRVWGLCCVAYNVPSFPHPPPPLSPCTRTPTPPMLFYRFLKLYDYSLPDG